MKIGKAKPKGIAGYTPPRKKGDPKRSDYTWGYPQPNTVKNIANLSLNTSTATRGRL